MNYLAFIIAKLIILIGKPLKRSSSLPGMIALKISKNIFKLFKIKIPIIMVTGSSGKGSISSLIASNLRNLNFKVGHNASGSNLHFAILTTIIDNFNLLLKTKCDYFVFEMDERYLPIVSKKLKIDYLLISNITRDQPPRQGHYDIVSDIILNAIKDLDLELILNNDDPYLKKFHKDHKTSYFSLDDHNLLLDHNPYTSLNMVYLGDEKLNYSKYIFEHLGKYHSSDPKYDYKESIKISHVDFNTLKMIIDDVEINLAYPLLFDIYNTAYAYTLLKKLGFSKKEIVKSFNNRYKDKKIYDHYLNNNRDVYVINNKNENATSFNQSLHFLLKRKEKKSIIIAWKEISRRYLFNDMSWLYDIDFEILENLNVSNIYCIGIQRYDIALRLSYTKLADKLKIYNDIEDCASELLESKENLYAILNFDYLDRFKEVIRNEN